MRYFLLICFLCLSVSVFGTGADRTQLCNDLTDGPCQGVTDDGHSSTIGEAEWHFKDGTQWVLSIADMDIGTVWDAPVILLYNPSSDVHMEISVDISGDGFVEIFSSPTLGTGAWVTVTARVQNDVFNGVSTNTTAFYTSASITASGTSMFGDPIYFGAGGPQRIGGSANGTLGMKTGIYYYVRYYTTANSKKGNLFFQYHEE